MLTITGVTHVYPGGVTALRDIDLEIPKGMYGLLGTNGAGKSSLMRAIATLQQPTTGDIRFGTIDVLHEPYRLRRVLGYLPQEFGVYPRVSALKLLDHLATLKGITRRKERRMVVEHLLKLTNLFDVRKHRVSTFSGGMRQRFGIAQVLIGKPKLVVVDEPTAGLDPEERNRFYNVLADIGEDVVVILSTHIVEDVSVLCPKFAVMSRGEIVLQGSPASLVAALNGQIWQMQITKSELTTYQQQHKIVSHKLSAGKSVVRIQAPEQPAPAASGTPATLEDVYFSAIHEHGDTA